MNKQIIDEFLELRKRAKKYASQSKRGLNSSRFDSSDIAQLSCLQIWQAWKDVEEAGIGDLVINDRYMKKVCSSKASNLIRFHTTRKRSVNREAHDSEHIALTHNTPLENAERNEQTQLLLEAISKLAEEDRKVVTMRYQMSMTLEEIAKSMDKSIAWVHRHLKKSLAEISGYMSA